MKRKSVITHILQRYWRFKRGLTLGAQGIIIDDKERVLLVRHTYRPGWHFPGGGVESNETIACALARELFEEAGVLVEGTPQLFGIYANFVHFPSDHIALFVVRDWKQPEPPESNVEIAAHGFFARDQLPPDCHPPVVRRLSEVFGGRARDANW